MYDVDCHFAAADLRSISERTVPGFRVVTSKSMTSLRAGRLSKQSAKAVMLLVVALFAAPTSARAGCDNHLLSSSSDPFVKLHHLDALILGRSSISLHDDRGGSPLDRSDAPRRTPCSGLSCSNSLPLPVSTVSPGPEGRDRWGNTSSIVFVDATSVHNRASDDPKLSPTGENSSIFHPPRV